ncbi:uncharacterized protein LOC110863482 isoform X3 [Folsomia candida]|uniref:uncharacterized protein LOC110863482 isoform X3 n=1 Tax=Folsomia candida TaxID=158441 RepID=UPI0016051597|nr:uncharacterized protein LOC110863482 isoform X3 [Folsomia candida]
MEIGDKKIGNVGIADTAASEVLGGDKKESQFATLTTDPSTTVPNEIWVKIFSHVTQKELVRHRLVCSSWRNVVDEHFNFSVIVHDDTTDLKRLGELKIKDCLITKLNADVDILRYPEIVKRVRFWGSIHPKSMHRILQNAINLEELSMTRYPLTQKNILPQNHVLDLKKLIKLEVLGYCCKDASEEVSTNVIRLISQIMPSLSRIFLNVTCYWKHMDSIITTFFEFLAKHRKQISHINVTLVPAANGHELISLLPTNIPQGTKDSLHDEQLQLESLRLNLATKYISCWTTIIQNQTKLMDFRINWISSYEQPPSHITGISSTILLPAIIQSASTLVYVELRELNLSMDDTRNAIPFDASVFKCAHNLRRLILMRNKEDCQRNLELYGSPTIVNIDNILPALTDLEIIRFKCLTNELQTLVESSQNLKSVKLQYNGSAIGQGSFDCFLGGFLDRVMSVQKFSKIVFADFKV